ncbi:DUF3775 domain-containing protein [Nitratireductor kimnyeongensis]|uniref:DUF3775 domain-containing protein n=1 Tax=Nitratireductor kimnyeongensis TaxID=430679 RepID=A0ABW0T812_9HYPH|nr:DUF3775 domain-containing protein [Nitratireductor kimnyeongensis]QZZ36046.1 DUF3775 domain-containing protein [Nitratireductor kimnyeongensis]
MQKPVEQEWALTIDPGTVRLLASKARILSAALNADYDDGHEHEIEIDGDARDRHQHDGLIEEEEEDLTEVEFRELVADLNVDEIAELIALAWVGRGDYDVKEWSTAVSDARQHGAKHVATYLLGMPMLYDWLIDGLDALGAS